MAASVAASVAAAMREEEEALNAAASEAPIELYGRRAAVDVDSCRRTCASDLGCVRVCRSQER